MKTDFDRERIWWDAKADAEEVDRCDERVNRALRWREIDRRLGGVRTILEVGGGTGAFSIPLAERGFDVTHVDFSPEMLEIAGQRAAGMENIRFVSANSTDLSGFDDTSFDLVLNMDGAVSFCGAPADQAIRECCRVARRRVIFSVTNRAWMIAVVVRASATVHGRLTPAVDAMFDRGTWHQDEFAKNEALAKGSTNDYCGPIRAFYPRELADLIESAGFRVVRCGGLGSLANLCGLKTVEILLDSDNREQFLDLCDRYDAEAMATGPGTVERAGVIAVADRHP